MSVKNIAVLLSRENDPAGPYALSLASMMGADVTAAGLVPEPVPDAAYLALPYALVEARHRDIRTTAARIVNNFREAATFAGLLVTSELLDAAAGSLDETIARFVRRYDFAVVGQPEPEHFDQNATIASAVLRGGRAALVVPHVHKRSASLQTVLVAWDESKAAARAIADAMPLLQRAETVEVVTVSGSRQAPRNGADFDVMKHLARHGVSAELKRIPSDVDVGNTLLSHAFDVQADLLVMGMYGHSEFRERLFGGVTRTILESTTLPVLLSH